VMLSPPGQNFGLVGLKHFTSDCHQSRCLYYVRRPNRTFSGTKNRVKSRILLIFPAIILNRMLLIIIWYFFHNYFWPRPWPQLPEIGLGFESLASASKCWPRLTSLRRLRDHSIGPYPVGYAGPFEIGTIKPLSLTVSDIFNGKYVTQWLT